MRTLSQKEIEHLSQKEKMNLKNPHFERVKDKILSAFQKWKDFKGKDHFGREIIIPCPPKEVIKGLDLKKEESIRFVYGLYNTSLLHATIFWVIEQHQWEIAELLDRTRKTKEYGL